MLNDGDTEQFKEFLSGSNRVSRQDSPWHSSALLSFWLHRSSQFSPCRCGRTAIALGESWRCTLGWRGLRSGYRHFSLSRDFGTQRLQGNKPRQVLFQERYRSSEYC